MNKVNKLLTLEQLVKFWQDNKLQNFCSKDSGYTLSVQVPGNLTFSSKESKTLLYTDVKVCHTLLNRNGSYISEENMKKAMPTLKNQPLLASIIEIDDEGTLDFNGHDMDVVENSDGTTDIKYIERQVGSFDATSDPYLKYDEKQDKTYVIATAVIPRGYTKASEIIERKNGTKVSCELVINNMSYNVEKNYLELTDFEFSGVCCLGEHVGEGMLGSRLDIKDFSTENNSVQFEQDSKLISIMQELKESLDKYTDAVNTAEKSMKGGYEEVAKTKIEEVTDTEDKFSEENVEVTEETTEEVAVDYENTEDVSPEVEENFDEENEEEIAETDEVESESVDVDQATDFEESEDTSTEEVVDELTENFTLEHTIVCGDTMKVWAVSLNDKLYAMQNLINEVYAEDGDYYSVEVFEDSKTVYFYGWMKSYRQTYKVKNGSFSLVGDRVEIHPVYMTDEEEEKFENMKKDFSSTVEKLDEVQTKLSKYEAEPKKIELLSSDKFKLIKDTKEFKELLEEKVHFDLSLEDVETKAKDILLDYAMSGKLKTTEQSENKNNMVFMSSTSDETENVKKPYGGIFEDFYKKKK